MTTNSKPARLRELIAKAAVIMPGVPNAAMARQVERAGFDAVYVSGAGMANATAGVPDIGLLTLTEVAQLAGYIAKAVKIPAIVDADTGFGGAENVARTIQELENAGLAGCHIEDQEFPKRCGHLAGKSLVDLEEMAGKIKAAVAARGDPNFMIIARTDARAVEGFDRAVERAGEYLAAGADGIFPEALQNAEEFRDFAKEIDLPLLANMTEFGKSPLLSFQQLVEFGYRMVIFPQSAFRVSMRASEKFFEALKKTGTQSDWIDRMQTRQELYDLLDYSRRPDRNRASRKVPAASASCRSNRIASRSSLAPRKTSHSLSSKHETRSAGKSPCDTRTPRAVESSTAGFCQTQSCSRATEDQLPSQNRETPRRFAMPLEKLHRRRWQDIRPLARARDRNLRPRARPFAR